MSVIKNRTIITNHYRSSNPKTWIKILDPIKMRPKKVNLGLIKGTIIFDLMVLGKSLYYFEKANLRPKILEFHTNYIDEFKEFQDDLELLFTSLTYRKIKINMLKNNNHLNTNEEKLKQYDSPIMLFSGGVDSFIGAALSKKEEGAILSHSVTNQSTQGKMRISFKKYLANNAVSLFEINSMFKGGFLKRGIISQMRTIMFTLNSVPLIEQSKKKKLLIFENGPFLINPPISDIAKPTKTSRPEVIDFLESFLKSFIGSNFRIELPFKNYTKSEIIASFDNPSSLFDTYSCFYTGGQGKKNMCGMCYACINRLLAFYAAGVKEPLSNYSYNLLLRKNFPSLDVNYNDYAKYHIISKQLEISKRIINEEELPLSTQQSIEDSNNVRGINSWDLMTKFALDTFLGLKNFYSMQKLDPKSFKIGQEYLKHLKNIDESRVTQRESKLKRAVKLTV